MNAINRFELTATDAWHDLEALSAGTRFDEIDAVPEGLFAVEGNGFTAIATVYVDLVDDDMEGASAYPDNFPAEVRGHFDASGEAIIETVSVDTSSFYA